MYAAIASTAGGSQNARNRKTRPKSTNLSKADVDVLSQSFYRYDKDGTGKINPDELHTLLTDLNDGDAVSKADVLKIMQAFDRSSDRELSFDEFVPLVKAWFTDTSQQAAAPPAKPTQISQKQKARDLNEKEAQFLTNLFFKYDTGGDGTINVSELESLLEDASGNSKKVDPQEVSDIMHQHDVSNDGTLSFDEFIPMVTPWFTKGQNKASGTATYASAPMTSPKALENSDYKTDKPEAAPPAKSKSSVCTLL